MRADGEPNAPRVDWHTYFMNIARQVATRSTCPRKHVGAVIVRDRTILSTGYNGSIRGLPHCSDVGCVMEDGHCIATVHAEANAIIQAAQQRRLDRGRRDLHDGEPLLALLQADRERRALARLLRRVLPRRALDPGREGRRDRARGPLGGEDAASLRSRPGPGTGRRRGVSSGMRYLEALVAVLAIVRLRDLVRPPRRTGPRGLGRMAPARSVHRQRSPARRCPSPAAGERRRARWATTGMRRRTSQTTRSGWSPPRRAASRRSS